jgi:protein-tyrosine phosphatase
MISLLKSPSLVIAYLIRYHQLSFKGALQLCKEKRPSICPNLGFELQLKAYEKKQLEKRKKSSPDLGSLTVRQKYKVLPMLDNS